MKKCGSSEYWQSVDIILKNPVFARLEEISHHGNSILKHMFPLTLRPPRYAESWVVTFSDKLVALSETGHYFRYLIKYMNKDSEKKRDWRPHGLIN